MAPEYKSVCWKALAGTLLAVLSAACQRAPLLKPLTDPHELTDEQQRQIRLAAPVVVVATIASDAAVGKPELYRSIPSAPVRLHRVLAQIENVLRGEIHEREQSIYYFHWDGILAGNRPLGAWRKGDRYVMYLKRDLQVLRLANDYWQAPSTIRVHSGSHQKYMPPANAPLEKSLADILLTKGDEISDQEFVKSFSLVGDWLGPYGFQNVLRESKFSSSVLVRREACMALKDWNKSCE